MTTVYAIVDGTIIWSSFHKSHKQGRVPSGAALEVLSDNGSWLEIEEPELDREVKTGYPNFWVEKDFVSSGKPYPTPQPSPQPTPEGAVSDAEMAEAVCVIVKWLKQ